MTLRDLAMNFLSILPLTVLVGWACVLLLVDAWLPRERKGLTALLAAAGLAVSLGLTLAQVNNFPLAGFGGMVVTDGFAVFLNILFLGAGLFGIAIAYDYLKRMGLERGEYYVLLLFSVGGMMLMAMAADLIVVFLALELLSIPLYVLSGFARPQVASEEAALKYFLLGAFSGGFVLYGVALVFGATGGTTDLAGVVLAVKTGSAQSALLTIGAALILIGLGFKVGAVPFHMWTPDVYHGAPTPVTAFMSVGAKAAGFAALLRVFVAALPATAVDLGPVIWGLAALTMIVGNVLAIAQGHLKRLLAYSSIAHAGYMLVALVPFGSPKYAPDATAAILFYLLAYALASFGAWAVLTALEKAEGQGLELKDLAGLGRRQPLLAAAMAVFMFSFAGVPPTLGFAAKFYVFRVAVESGALGLALLGVFTALLSAYYYLRVIVVMFMQDGEQEQAQVGQGQALPRLDFWLGLTAGAAALATLGIGVFSHALLNWAAQAMLRGF